MCSPNQILIDILSLILRNFPCWNAQCRYHLQVLMIFCSFILQTKSENSSTILSEDFESRDFSVLQIGYDSGNYRSIMFLVAWHI